MASTWTNCLLILIIATCNLIKPCKGQYTREQLQRIRGKGRKLPGFNVCGISPVFGTRVIGGSPADLGEYPWMAAVGYVVRDGDRPTWQCAGSLITDRYVISAAHCFHPSTLTRFVAWRATVIRLGDLDQNEAVVDHATPTDYEIEKIVYHEQYDNRLLINDIALIKTKYPVRYTALVVPICLPVTEFHTKSFFGYSPVVAGWGLSSVTLPRTDSRLLEAFVEIRDTDACRRNVTTLTEASFIIDNRVICASSPGKDLCQGDSGGPLMFFRQLKPGSDGNYFLMGIVSYAFNRCATEKYPGIYTRVSEYMAWIMYNLEI